MADKMAFAQHFVDDLPEAASRVLEEQRSEAVSSFIDRIPDRLSSKALTNMLPQHAARSVAPLEPAAAARYLAALPAQAVAGILRHTAPETRQAIGDALPAALSLQVGVLLHYPRYSVGAWTDTSAPALLQGGTVAEATARLREMGIENHCEIYLLDGQRKPRARVGVGELFWTDGGHPMAEIALPVRHRLNAGTALVSVVDDRGWSVADALPVVDRAGAFLGLIRFVDLRRGLAEAGGDDARTGDHGSVMDLATIWYEGLAGAMDVALAPNPQPAPKD